MQTVIHVGLHKTATTFLQQQVWPLLRGITVLTRPFTQLNHAWNQLQFADDTLYDERHLRRCVEPFEDRPLLILDEALCGKPVLFACLNRSIIARRLRALFPEATVVLFIRDQRAILESHYHSYVKMVYGSRRIDWFLWKPSLDYSYEDYCEKVRDTERALYYNTNDFHLHLDCFRYAPVIELYRELFPNVEVFLYEDLVNDPAAVLARLGRILGQPDALAKADVELRVNRSLPATALEKHRRGNRARQTVRVPILRAAWRWLAKALPARPPQLALEVDELVGDYYVKDNQRLRELLPSVDWSQLNGLYR